MTNDIHLSHDGWDITLSPKFGACILRCDYQGHPVLRPARQDWHENHDPTEAACYPLIPYSNRIENGQFTYGGKNIHLPPNHPGQSHPLHGLGWKCEWDITSASQSKCELSFTHKDGEWPWPFKAAQMFSVSGHQLTLELSITNVGNTVMPTGLGFHPFFPANDGTGLKFKSAGIWRSGPDLLPKTWTAMDFAKSLEHDGPRIKDLRYDHCFTGWDGQASIDQSSAARSVNVSGSSSLGFIVLYTPKDEDYFCFEPVTHMNNAVNWDSKVDNSGLIHLPPGETASAVMRLDAL